MKRVLAVILTFVMLFSMVACGNSRDVKNYLRKKRKTKKEDRRDDPRISSSEKKIVHSGK